MRCLRFGVLVVMIAAASVIGPTGGIAAHGAEPAPYTMTVDPTHGVAGDEVELTATSCVDPGTDVNIVLFQPGENTGGVAGQAGRVVADEDGSFVTTVQVPQVVQSVSHPAFRGLVLPGDYQFVAVPYPEGQSLPCIAAFHVDRSVTLPLTVSPTTGPAGSTVEVEGTCFSPSQFSVSVHAEIDHVVVPDSQLRDFVVTGPAEQVGLDRWRAPVTLPADLADGTAVSFVGGCGGVDYVPATFVVAAATTTTPPAPVVEAVVTTAALTG